jgi:beta-phosphoglucomutase-like phosphatase (HAD superfamily)
MTPPPLHIEALLFDLDGTLADTGSLNVAAYTQALREAGIAVADGVLEREAPGRHWRQFLPPIIESARARVDPARIADRKKSIYAGLVDRVRLNDALLALLTACRPFMRTALVTTASAANVSALLTAHALHPHFEVIVTGDDVQRHKPDPEAYLLAARRLAVDPARCLAFEDSDIGEQSARSAGMKTQRVTF